PDVALAMAYLTPMGKRVREEMRWISVENDERRARVDRLSVKHDERTGNPM
ncbi:hypothetical protein TorRG33x02_153610, partial [Trema orientale]